MTARRVTPELAKRLTVDAEPWLSCEECFEQVDGYVEALLADPGHDDPRMRAHLRGCGACAEEARGLLELAAQDSGTDPAPLLPGLDR
jgi:hypothetical protein